MILLGSQALGAPSERTMIEAALLVLLESLSVRQGRYLARLDQYNGGIGAGMSVDEILGALGGATPAVLLQTSSATRTNGTLSRRRLLINYQIEILIASGHLRSLEARNIGDEASARDASSDPGAYQIMADVRDALDGHNVGVAGVGVPRWVSEQVVIQVPALTAWVSRFEVDFHHEQLVTQRADHAVSEVEARSNLEHSAAVNPVAVGKATADG